MKPPSSRPYREERDEVSRRFEIRRRLPDIEAQKTHEQAPGGKETGLVGDESLAESYYRP